VSSESLAIVRTFCDAVVADDLNPALDLLDQDVVWFGTRGGLDQDRVLRGREAFVEYLAEVTDLWERFEADAERFIETGDAVVVFFHETGRARHADLEVHSDTAAVFKVRHGKIVEVRGYLDREEALEAARLTK
jgi:ketosteroid isomerase-like protein